MFLFGLVGLADIPYCTHEDLLDCFLIAYSMQMSSGITKAVKTTEVCTNRIRAPTV